MSNSIHPRDDMNPKPLQGFDNPNDAPEVERCDFCEEPMNGELYHEVWSQVAQQWIYVHKDCKGVVQGRNDDFLNGLGVEHSVVF